MAKSKGVRIGITIECQTSEGVYRYRTTKKYCPLSKKHEIFKEIK